MTEKKELNNEELEKVTGGLADKSGFHLENPVDKYAVHNFDYLYFVSKRNNSLVLYARVIEQREQKIIFNATITVFDVEVIDKTRWCSESGYVTLYCNEWQAYEKCNYQN